MRVKTTSDHSLRLMIIRTSQISFSNTRSSWDDINQPLLNQLRKLRIELNHLKFHFQLVYGSSCKDNPSLVEPKFSDTKVDFHSNACNDVVESRFAQSAVFLNSVTSCTTILYVCLVLTRFTHSGLETILVMKSNHTKSLHNQVPHYFDNCRLLHFRLIVFYYRQLCKDQHWILCRFLVIGSLIR